MIRELRKVAGYFYGDYYPLTSYSLDNSVWMAWQFDRPDLGEGMVQVFRRAEGFYESAHFPLRGLDLEARMVKILSRAANAALNPDYSWPHRNPKRKRGRRKEFPR